MNTMEDDNFDYQAYTQATPPDPAKIRRGTSDRRQRFEATMMRRAVRIDEDLLKKFQQLVAEGQGCEQLINQTLREWLAAKGMREMVREEIQLAVRQSLATTQIQTESPQA